MPGPGRCCLPARQDLEAPSPVPGPGLRDGGRPPPPGTWDCLVPGSQVPTHTPPSRSASPSRRGRVRARRGREAGGAGAPGDPGPCSWVGGQGSRQRRVQAGASQADRPTAAAAPASWHPPVQVVDEVSRVVGQDDAVLAHVAVVPQHAHRHVRRHFGKLPENVVEGPWEAHVGRDPP